MISDLAEGSAFFGRQTILALLAKRLEAFQNGFRQNIGIVGRPRIGKSSLLQVFLERAQRGNFITVSFSCQESDSFERFGQRWMSEILLSVHHMLGKPVPTDLQALLRSLKSVVPATLRRMKSVKKLIHRLRYGQAYRELLTVSEVLSKECNKKILFVLDDFDRLADLPLEDPFGALGSEIMIQKDTMYLVSSSYVSRSSAILREKMSLLFGNFEVIELEAFDFEEASNFISQYLPDDTIEAGVKRFLIRLTDAHPYYLTLLLKPLAVGFSSNDQRARERLTETIVTQLYERESSLYHDFMMRLYRYAQGRPWTAYADVLLAISLGHKKMSQIVPFLRVKTGEVRRMLDRLVHSEVIDRHGSLHVVREPLFRFWLSKVYYRRRFFSERVPRASRQSFAQDVSHAIEEDIAVDQLDLSKRVEELFRKFRNDTIFYGDRRLRCPNFTEVTSRPTNGRMFPVLAKNAHTRWLCQILVHPVTEEDIQQFVHDLKRLRSPVHKRIIVALKGIDLNAKLLAQEAKIQYFDLQQFNFLTDVYDQPKFIL